jgi:hypothetical protein
MNEMLLQGLEQNSSVQTFIGGKLCNMDGSNIPISGPLGNVQSFSPEGASLALGTWRESFSRLQLPNFQTI